ncbi:MAG: hypothetical protein R3F21_24730 [Myxococcota bacterium]
MRSVRAFILVRGVTAASTALLLLLALAASAAVFAPDEARAQAAAGSGRTEMIRIEVEFFANAEPVPVNRATVHVFDRRVRVEQRGAEGSAPAPVFLYRGDQDRLYSIVDSARTYVQIERKMIEQLGGGSGAGSAAKARREVDRQLEGIPQDQARLYGHLLGRSALDPSRPEDPLVIARTGERATAAGYACQRATIHRSGRLLAAGCVADWDVVGLTPEDVEVFRSLALLARDAMTSRSPMPKELVPGQPLDLIVQLGGFPVHFERAGEAAGDSAVRVASIERIAVDDALFEVPPGYAARKGMAGLMGFANLLARPARTPARTAPSSDAPGPAAIAGGDPFEERVATADPASARDGFEPAESPRSPSRRTPTRWTPRPYRSIGLFGD